MPEVYRVPVSFPVIPSTGGAVYAGSGTTLGVTAAGTSGQVLTSNGVAAPTWQTPAAPGVGTVTSVAMTVPTGLAVAGSPITSAGTLAVTLTGGAVIPVPSALTKTDDTNVTLTLGGAPTTALITAASITAGWTGQLSLTRGGTAANLTAVNGGAVYSTASALAVTAAGTTGQVLTSQGAAAPVWVTPATGTSGLTLVQRQTVTSDVTDVTFSGLDGDTDQVYTIIGRTIVPGAAGSAYNLSWQPNAITTNQTAQRFYADGATVGASTYSDLHIQAANSGGVAHSFQLTIHAAKVINGVATRRTYFATWQSRQGADSSNVIGGSAGQWNETSTNITSLVIHCDTASKIGDGSTFALYKYAQS